MASQNPTSPSSPRPLRLLIVEDNAADAELLVATLKRAGYSVSFDIVDSPGPFQDFLAQDSHDIILSDHNLRTWTGMDALQMVKKAGKQVPFVVVTGNLGDEAAVDYIKQGADDYLLKHRPERLPVAVGQALRDKARREEAARLQNQILAAKREWELTFDGVPNPVFLFDETCRIKRANRAATDALQKKFSELIGQPCSEAIHGQAEAPATCPHLKTIESGREERADLLVTRLGRTFHCLASPLRDSSGNFQGCVFVMHDVTERKRAEDALRQSEEQLRLLLDSTAETIFGLDLEGKCTFCNTSGIRLFGYGAPEDLLGKNMHDLVHGRYSDGRPYPREECPIRRALRTGEVSHSDCEVFWRADGTSFPVEYWSHPVVRDSAIVGSVVAFLDITDRRRLEEQLRQSQKMEAIGRLAGGIAHDFNNLLTIILGYAQLAQGRLGPDHPLRSSVEEIKKAGERAASLTRQLLAFGRRQVLMPQVLDLNSVTSNMDKMLRRLIGEDIELVTVAEPDLGRVKADPGQIEQIIMNLAVNARDAMPEGGRLLIETANVTFDPTYANRHADTTPGPYVMLAVSDTGVGMSPETQAQIFEPFFTTKEKGKGTGLGLATVYGIVRQSGGHIWVYSEPGRGSTFKIYFPRIREAVSPHPSHQQVAESRGSETILVVEDEGSLRAMVQEVLESKGYRVMAARSGEDALQVVKQYTGRVDLLLTDMVMPGMDGKTLADHLSSFYRSLKILFVSGYTDNAAIFHGVLNANAAFLQKPFTPEVLAGKVREVLDSAPARGEAA